MPNASCPHVPLRSAVRKIQRAGGVEKLSRMEPGSRERVAEYNIVRKGEEMIRATSFIVILLIR